MTQQELLSLLTSSEDRNNFFKKLLSYVIVLVIGLGVGYYLEYKHINPQLDQANKLVAMYEKEYATAKDEREAALIENAKLKEKEPEKLQVEAKADTEIAYVEKAQESDPDVNIEDSPQEIKVAYNGEEYNLPMKKVETSTNTNKGTVVIKKESKATLDVTDVVNREIANTIMKKDAELEKANYQNKVLKRQKIQNTAWGIVGGLAVGYAAGRLK